MEGAARFIDPLSADWATGVFLSCLLIMATVNVGSPRKWRVLRQAAFRIRLGRQVLREEVDTRDRNVIGLLAVSVAAMAMLLWQSSVSLGTSPAGLSYLQVFGAVALALLAQALVLRLVSFLVKADAGITEYVYTGALLHAAVGIATLPLAALAAYRPEWRAVLLPAGLALIGLGLVYRWVRCAWIGLGEGVPFRYVLLYLCGAEIAPLALALNALRSSPTHLS